LLDRELSGAERRDLTARLRQDPRSLDELIEARRMLEMLREPVVAPDLTDRVLAGVERRRGFLSTRLRRRVRAGRAAVAASVLLGLFGLAVAHRLDPGLFRLHSTSTPVADLGAAVRADSLESRQRLVDAVRGLASVGGTDAGDPMPGSISLAAFHVESDHNGSVPAPEAAPGRFLVLSASADAEVVALGGVGSVFLSVMPAPAAGGLTPGDGSWLGRTVAPADSAGLAAMDAVAARAIPPGAVPMSFGVAAPSAYVGSLDFLGVDRIDSGHLRPRPLKHLPSDPRVSSRREDR